MTSLLVLVVVVSYYYYCIIIIIIIIISFNLAIVNITNTKCLVARYMYIGLNRLDPATCGYYDYTWLAMTEAAFVLGSRRNFPALLLHER